MNRKIVSLVGVIALALTPAACGSSSADDKYAPPPLGPLADGGSSVDATTTDGAQPVITPDGSPTSFDADVGPCTTTFTFVPPPGTSAHTVAVTGEWNAFAGAGVPMTGPDANGAYSARVPLSPGLVAYKVVLNGALQLDPGSGMRKYVGGVENSAVEVFDCHLPTLTFADKTITRASAGAGHFVSHVRFGSGAGGPSIDPATLTATLRKDTTTTKLAPPLLAPSGLVTIDAPQLADGKYTVFVDAKDRAGNAARTLRLVFWIEAEAYDWRDSLLYMAFTDRFQNGDTSNDPKPTANVDPRADYQGGDLQGITARIADGTFDKLGVRVLWVSPFHQNPPDAFAAADNIHQVMGYHGYWPIDARKVEPRFGGEAALHALVTAAHAHGMRVMQDFVVNHVHQEHPYFKQHPEWFRTGCICGTANCDWTVHRLDCLFEPYMPDVNWTVPEVNDQFDADAIWWLDTFDIDALRIDAVKHVEDASTMNMAARIRREFEASGTKVFLTGETAMGWGDCTQPNCPGNQDNYGTVSHYIGPHGLDGQFDFTLYYAVPANVFFSDNKGMIHADYWTQASQWEYPAGAIMSTYIGSQDTPRFATLANYRGQDGAHGTNVPGNQWDNIAGPPNDSEPFARTRLAMEWLLTVPGAPMIYYGDEYGQWGGADPNNRMMWRGGGALSSDEQSTLATVQKLGQARKELVALRRGAYEPVTATQDVLVFARQAAGGETAFVGITRATSAQTITVAIPASLATADGTKLHDRLGGPDVTVTNGSITMTLGARGAAILAK